MKIKHTPLKYLTTGLCLGAAALVPGAPAQSPNDALIDQLVKKGILTQAEASDLKKESASNFSKSYHVQTGLPEWVTSLKLTGDIRTRFEAFYAHAEDATGNDLFVDRNRLRFRARLGIVATLWDDFEAGFRLTTAEPVDNFGGDPISGNQSFKDNGSFKSIWVDRAYGKWSPKFGPLAATTTIGKMDNPFLVSDTVFDPDYAPEGISQQFKFTANDANSLSLNLAGFMLDELAGDSDDPYLLGAQIRWDGKFTQRLDATVGVAAFLIDNEEALTPANIPNTGRGNSPGAQFNPIVADASIGFNLDHFPSYSFPIRVLGEYMYNPAMDDRNQAFMGGLSVGKAGKKGTWEL